MIFFKINIVLKILSYMFYRMLVYNAISSFTSKANLGLWIDKHLYQWSRFCMRILKIRLTVKGSGNLEKVDWNRNMLFVSNHQSYADIPALYCASHKTFGFIAKYELSRIPFLHFWMKALGCVLINRSKYILAIKTLKKLEKQGHACKLTIFPEGTRSKNNNVGAFKTGALKIAWQLDALLLPTLIVGTRDTWENRTSVLGPYEVTVYFKEPLDLRLIKETQDFESFLKTFEEYFQVFHRDPES